MYRQRKPAWDDESSPRRITFISGRTQPKISPKNYKISKNMRHKTDSFSKSALEIGLVGYNRLRDPNYSKIGKIIWVFVYICCIVTLVYYVTTRVCYMNSHSLVSNMMIAREPYVTFPSMTLCPSALHISMYTIGVGNSAEEIKLRDTFYKTVFQKNPDIRRLFNSLTIFEDAIAAYIPCEKGDDDYCEMKIGKKVNMTMQPVITFWGTCLAISTDKKLLFRGPFSYLRIMVNMSKLDLSLVENIKGILDDLNVTSNPFAVPTILYHIYPKGFETDKHDIFYFGMKASAKTRLNLQLSYTKFMFYNSSTRVCLKPEEVSVCKNKFIDKILEDNLPCSLFFIENTYKNLCKDMNDSFVGLTRTFQMYSTLNFTSYSCPEACNTTSYSITKLVEHSNTTGEMIEFKIFYLEESYELTKEKMIYDVMDYVSEVGGMFGFFLGFCVLSILELIDFLIHWIWKKSKDC